MIEEKDTSLFVVVVTGINYKGVNMKNKELSTIQKREKLNRVCRVGEATNGGAYHNYEISYIEQPDLIKTVGYVNFQKGARHLNDSQHGVTDQDLLEIVRDRLTCFANGDMPTTETAEALRHVEIALMYLNKRVEDRLERNVLGTNKQ